MELLAYGDSGYGDELLRGFALTMSLAIGSYFFSLLLGTLLGFVALSEKRGLYWSWRIYASIAMGVPSLLVIFFIYFNFPVLVGMLFGITIEVSPLTAGLIALTLVYGAYIGEVVRGAVGNVPRGQSEAGKALGLQIFPLWFKVIIPQAVKLALPGLSNLWLIMLKDTALVSLVGLNDIVREANVAAGSTQRPFLFYFVTMFAFLLATGFSMMAIRRAEAYGRTSDAGSAA